MMRNIVEPLLEVEDIINYHMEIIHKLAEIADTTLKDDLKAKAAVISSMCNIWSYLKPVHIWIRDQNRSQANFYDELDKYLSNYGKHPLDIKDLLPNVPKAKKGKK